MSKYTVRLNTTRLMLKANCKKFKQKRIHEERLKKPERQFYFQITEINKIKHQLTRFYHLALYLL